MFFICHLLSKLLKWWSFQFVLLVFSRNLSGNETAEHHDVYNSDSPSSQRPWNFKFILKYLRQCTKYLRKISLNNNCHSRSLIEDIDRTQLEFLTAEVLLDDYWFLSSHLITTPFTFALSIKMADSVKVPWMVTPIEFLGIEAEITGSAYMPSKVTFSSSALEDMISNGWGNEKWFSWW